MVSLVLLLDSLSGFCWGCSYLGREMLFLLFKLYHNLTSGALSECDSVYRINLSPRVRGAVRALGGHIRVQEHSRRRYDT